MAPPCLLIPGSTSLKRPRTRPLCFLPVVPPGRAASSSIFLARSSLCTPANGPPLRQTASTARQWRAILSSRTTGQFDVELDVEAQGARVLPAISDEASSSQDGTGDAMTNCAGDFARTGKRGPLSKETKRKIAFAMMGQPKTAAMRAKVSQKLKGRVPWNKGKKMSAETRARMSQARFGRNPWNKGRRLSEGHRTAIAASSRGVTREISPATRKRLRMARRRPGDAIVAGGVPSGTENGEYPLVETTDINLYVTLRRELRTWSDEFAGRNGRRPSLVDVRRIAPPDVIGKFERYVGMRDRLRGLAADVYGTINPDCIPSVRPSQIASTPQNNNQGSILRYTSHGNARLVPKGRPDGVFVDRAKVEAAGASAARRDIEKPGKLGTWGQWDAYDLPTRGDYSSGFEVSETVRQGLESDERAFTAAAEKTERVPKKEAKRAGLSANDYRAIGKYRLMESIDINRYVQLRRDLMAWSSSFKEKRGHTPTLSDVQAAGDPRMYRRFREYIETRDRMDGLVKEVCGAEIDDLEQIKELSDTGRALVDQLRPKKVERSTPAEPASSLENVGPVTALSPPSMKEL